MGVLLVTGGIGGNFPLSCSRFIPAVSFSVMDCPKGMKIPKNRNRYERGKKRVLSAKIPDCPLISLLGPVGLEPTTR
jgi:hypothetical protein